MYANEVPFSIIRVSAAYLTSELAGRCGPMHIKQARGAEMICSGQSVCLPVLICTGGLDSKGRDVVHAGQWLPAARHLDADDRRGRGRVARCTDTRSSPAPTAKCRLANCIDWLERRPDVDRFRIAVCGSSFGGYCAARFEIIHDRPLARAANGCEAAQ
ncbi:MAG TPA: hypothetical protein VFP38_03290 [Bradyrhizobium sp.]|nr:hypothetical protein [Bradyrhizobium sp.]